MRVTGVAYLAVTSVLIGLVYLLYKTQTRPITAEDVYIQAPMVDHAKDDLLHGTFSEARKSFVLHQKDFNPIIIPFDKNSSFDYKSVMKKLNDARVSQDDPRLIKLIRDYYIEPPSTSPYNLLDPNRLEYSNGQTPFVDSRLNYMVSLLSTSFFEALRQHGQ